jgi:hypothetical protein
VRRVGVIPLAAHDAEGGVEETGVDAIKARANQCSGDGSDGHRDRNGDNQAAERRRYKHLSAPSIVRTV